MKARDEDGKAGEKEEGKWYMRTMDVGMSTDTCV